ncbi:hypothetical protein BLOT_004004 [Blomia tropicalis]|nr:hypothetical protein BLOT_004004 [Blomia tropicalis]
MNVTLFQLTFIDFGKAKFRTIYVRIKRGNNIRLKCITLKTWTCLVGKSKGDTILVGILKLQKNKAEDINHQLGSYILNTVKCSISSRAGDEWLASQNLRVKTI